ncbi:retrovirus-related Pol polyprotein from transposon 297 [Trichonephila clavipes]|nr:retrovirus-related Pol polyprotein from transposon 297 [Trichonephila clavipes]
MSQGMFHTVCDMLTNNGSLRSFDDLVATTVIAYSDKALRPTSTWTKSSVELFAHEELWTVQLRAVLKESSSPVAEDILPVREREIIQLARHRIGSGSRSPSDLKIKAIADFPRPTTKTQVRSFLGLVGYYSHYIPNYSTIASPLTDALKGKIKKEKITWDEKCGKAFEELKAKLVSQSILFAPDFATDFILQTDASEVGAGVVLSQRIEGEEHPIVFLSKKFSKAERNYSTVERELSAIIFGLKRLKHCLDGQKFIIETDHNPLRYLNKMGSTKGSSTRGEFTSYKPASKKPASWRVR